MSKLNTFTAQHTVDVSADQAWKALENMHVWVPQLSSNSAIEYDDSDVSPSQPFLTAGRRYIIITRENIRMTCTITEISEKQRIVKIQAQHKPLTSHLVCLIIPRGDSACTLVRTQEYPGFVGTLFVLLFSRREGSETQEYLHAWARFAMRENSSQSVEL